MEKRQQLYKGKAKTVYATDDPSYLVMHYRDDVSAFDGVKLAKLDKKGETNNKINAYVMGRLAAAGIDLVDYKLEFGHPVADPDGPLVLGDEFTPDGCRLWDVKTGEKLDKDRFRRDLGSVIEHYREVGSRIGAPL